MVGSLARPAPSFVGSFSINMDDDDEWDDWGEEDVPPPKSATAAPVTTAPASPRRADHGLKVDAIVRRLKEFQLNMCDPRTFEALNNSTPATLYANTVKYYQHQHNASKLQHQTLMDIARASAFTLRHVPRNEAEQPEPQTTDDTRTIQRACEAACEAAEAAEASAQERQLALLWGMCNQSIYGDLLAFLQPFLQADLLVGLTNLATSYEVDATALTLDTSCQLQFCSTIHASGSSGSSSSGSGSGSIAKLPLASIVARVCVDVGRGSLRYELTSPRLAPCFDDELEAAAICILSMAADDAGGGRGGRGGRRGC